ncbi:hypothetical protein MTZ49_07670 [Entomomonas sp. E2T0]|uniref:hypothetical protein n=1 Tax=Entomomonas sp. E2T0 TaxID=2930213 RepID=UPI0022284C70|nr:hypothetical protein [Entomomonas sp. E2T0]UYZ85417.1 hypothetical protein MTZ49_07670 [Entomomonas sp. E2T0]
MNPKNIVKLSNFIGIIAIICLIYWVFIFTSVTVFDLKIFRQRMTETFLLSIFGIITLMAGALMINIMFNLTRIAEKHNTDQQYPEKNLKKWLIILMVSFPLIFGLLVCAHQLSIYKRKEVLINSAHSVLENYPQYIQQIADYSFAESWINSTKQTLRVLSQTDSQLPHLIVIVKDQLDENSPVYLSFGDRYYDENKQLTKIDYLFKTTKPQREYFDNVFKGQTKDIRYEHKNSSYKLFYPYQYKDKTVIFLFSDYYSYGKLGS